MNKNSNLLDLFFEQEVFELDSEDVAKYLLDYSGEQIKDSLNKKLKNLALSRETLIEEPWKLGVIFKSVENQSVDKFLLSKLYSAELNIKETYFEFLSGFWEKIGNEQLPFISEYSDYIVKSISVSNWPHELIMKSIEPFALSYLNNRDIFEQDVNFIEKFNVVKKYAQASPFHCPARELLCST